MDDQNKINLNFRYFIEQLCRYYMEFLETDFKKRRNPSRKIAYRTKGLITGVPLFKYDKLRKNLIEAIINNFRTNTLSNIAKGKYVIRFSDEFLEKVNDDIEKINFEDFHIKDVIDLVDKNLEKTTAERETILGELEFEIKDLLAESEGKVNKEDIIDLLLNTNVIHRL